MADANFNRLPVDRKLLTRFFAKVRVSTDNFYKGVPCWEWTGALDTQGYGTIGYKGRRSYGSHILSVQMFVGLFKKGLVCDHLCRNVQCVNPIHLEAVTQKINVIERGVTNACAVNARKTHCIRGHAFTPENTVSAGGPNGEYRRCKTCQKAKQGQYGTTSLKRLMSLPADDPRKVRHYELSRERNRRYRLKQKLSLS